MTGTAFTDTGLASGAMHSYTVSAFDAVPNESALSSQASATTQGGGDTAAPTVPVNVAATAGGPNTINSNKWYCPLLP